MRLKLNFFRLQSQIQYLWVGAPVTTDIDEPGIDISGPAQTAKALSATGSDPLIVYYCQDNYVNDFSRLFMSYPYILVRSIDILFTNLITDDSNDFLKRAKEVFDRDKVGCARSRVDAKNLGSLMLLYFCGGYYLDTTVFPGDRPLKFTTYDSFMVPLLPEDRTNRLITYRHKNRGGADFILPYFREGDGTPEDQFTELLTNFERTNETSLNYMIDVYAMFSPKKDQAVARAIKTFVQFFPVLQRVRSTGTEPEIASVAVSLIDSAINNGYFGNNSRSKKWLSPYEVTEDNQVKRKLDFLGCYKVFGGSHVSDEPASEPIYF